MGNVSCSSETARAVAACVYLMKLLNFLFLFPLAGCGLFPQKYIEPTGPNTASLTIDLGDAARAQVMRMQAYAFGEASTCSYRSRIVDLFATRNETKYSTRIPAGKEFGFMLVPSVLNKFTVIHMSFRPAVGSDYIAAVRCSYGDRICTSVILEKKLDGSLEEVKDVTRRKHNIDAFNDRNYCLHQ